MGRYTDLGITAGMSIIPELITIIIASPILIILSVLFGVLSLSYIISSIFNIQLIILTFIISTVLYLLFKRRFIKFNKINLSLIGALLITIYSYLNFKNTSLLCQIPIIGGAVCSISAVAFIPLFISSFITILIWLSVFMLIIKMVAK
jgi:hypothetical protein